MGVTFTVVPSNFDEHLDDSRAPFAVAQELARGKAMAVAKLYPDAIVIGSDLVLAVDGHQLGNAFSRTEADAMLTLVTKYPNQICNAVCVICLDEQIEVVEVTKSVVYLKPYNKRSIEAYLQTGDYLGKAGGYGVQTPAAGPLIDHIEGDFDAVVGLPTKKLSKILNKLGVPAHPADYPPPPGLIVI